MKTRNKLKRMTDIVLSIFINVFILNSMIKAEILRPFTVSNKNITQICFDSPLSNSLLNEDSYFE